MRAFCFHGIFSLVPSNYKLIEEIEASCAYSREVFVIVVVDVRRVSIVVKWMLIWLYCYLHTLHTLCASEKRCSIQQIVFNIQSTRQYHKLVIVRQIMCHLSSLNTFKCAKWWNWDVGKMMLDFHNHGDNEVNSWVLF